MNEGQIFSLAIALGAVCVCALIVVAIFELAVTAYAVRRSHDERSFGKAGYLPHTGWAISNLLIIGLFGIIAVAILGFPHMWDAFFSGPSWIYALLGVAFLISGCGRAALGTWLNRKLARKPSGDGREFGGEGQQHR